MPAGSQLWIWDATNKEWVRLAGTSEGAMSIHALVEELNDIEDVDVASPSDLDMLYWNNTNSKWEAKGLDEFTVPAHKDRHDPEDGADPLDCAAPGAINAAASAEGSAHSFARSDHNHQHTAALHENGGDAEISVAGLSGLLADDQHVLDAEVLAVAAALTHASQHENGGADEISVAGLSGELADDQPPKAHASDHQNGGSDEVSVAGLSGLLADDQHVLDSEVIAAVGVCSITFIIDGGGSAITTGEKGHLEIPFACTINQVTVLADQSGSIVVDIWKDSYANFPPTDADSITASAPPTLSSAQKAQDSTLTGWTTAISAGDILAFNVDSCSTITRVTIALKVTRT